MLLRKRAIAEIRAEINIELLVNVTFARDDDVNIFGVALDFNDLAEFFV